MSTRPWSPVPPLPLLLLSFAACVAASGLSDRLHLEQAATALKSMTQLGRYQVMLIVSENMPGFASKLGETLSSSATAFRTLTPGEAQRTFPAEVVCADDNNEFVRMVTPYRLTRDPFIVFSVLDGADEVRTVLDAFESSMPRCVNYLKPGYYFTDNLIAYYFANSSSTIPEVILDNKFIKRHRRVTVFRSLPGILSMVGMRYNIFTDSIARFLVDAREGLADPALIWDDFKMQGHVIKAVTMPYDMYVMGIVERNEENIRKSVTVTGGVESSMLEIICEVALDCIIEYFNPIDFRWGNSVSVPTGMFAELAEDRADIALSAVGAHEPDYKLGRFAGYMDVGLFTICCPIPKPSRSVLTLVRPMNYSVWLSTIGACFLVPIVMFFIAKKEEKIIGKSLEDWSKYINSLWYSLSTLIGENITATLSSEGAWAIRVITGTWMWVAFVVTSSYSGNLRAFLITPFAGRPIDTIAELVESELTWNMVQYGEPIEDKIKNSKDQVMYKFYEKMEIVPYKDFAFDRMMDVYEGRSCMLEYAATIDTTVDTAFKLPTGKRLVYTSRTVSLNPTIYTTFVFHALNPWIDRFNKWIYAIIETGINPKLKFITRAVMRAGYLKELEARNELTPVEKLISGGLDTLQNMNMEDIRGIFIVYFFCLFFPIVFFFWEIKPDFRKAARRARTKMMLRKMSNRGSNLAVANNSRGGGGGGGSGGKNSNQTMTVTGEE